MKIFEEKRIQYICEWLSLNKPDHDCDFYRMWIAIEILRVLIDNEWTNQAIFPNNHPVRSMAVKSAVAFLRTDQQGLQFQARVYMLANRLYDIQEIPNVERVISAIKQGDIALGYAEIEASSFFKRRGINHEFVIPAGKKGNDFDIRLIDFGVNCEVKHKIEGTKLNKKELERILTNAKHQLPLDQPAIIFIKIPEEWKKHPDISTVVERTMKYFFSRSDNVVGILFHWEERAYNNPHIFTWKYRYENNDSTRFKNFGFADKFIPDGNEDSIIKLMNIYLEKCRNYSGLPGVYL